METYIKDNISIANKNNQIIIRIGKEICDGIFDIKFTKTTIENFLTSLSKYYNLDQGKNTNLKIYSNQNSITEIDNFQNKIHYSYETDNYQIFNYKYDVSIYILKKLKYDDSLISIYKYNNIIDTQLYSLDINGLFTLNINNQKLNNSSYEENKYIDNSDEYYTITFIIKKPNNYKTVTDKLEELLKLI